METPAVPLKNCTIQEYYDAFAPYYDDFYDLIDYAEWAQVIQSHIPSVENSTHRILEIGCGTGALLAELWKNGDQIVIGLDLSSNMLRLYRSKIHTDIGSSLVQGDALSLCFLPNSFVAVIGNFSLLSHFDRARRSQLLREVFAVLRNGGVFVTDFATLSRYRQLVQQPSVTELVKKEGQIAEIRQASPNAMVESSLEPQNLNDRFWLERTLKTQKHCVNQRLYFFDLGEIALDFCAVGFQLVEQSSPVPDSFDHAPNRIMLVARKP